MDLFATLALLSAVAAGPPETSVEASVEAAGPAGPLKGTMLAPASKSAPVLLIIPGSGPTDRDGNNPLGVKASTYRLLAEGLVEQGITTVRIDKRGMFGSASAIPDANAVSIPDYVADIRSWTMALRERTGAPCIWLLGHSEGGLVALAAAADVPDLCGLLLVAAPGRPIGEALREQLRAHPAFAPLLDEAFAAVATLESGKRVESANMSPALLPLFAPQVQNFLISLLSYDPARLLAGFGKPVLILHGQRDIQASEQDARRLKNASAHARLVVLADVNHVLKSVASDDRGANIATYADPSLPLAPNVVETIADFVSAATAASKMPPRE